MGDEARTLNELFNNAVERFRDRELLRFKSGDEWRSLSYGEVARRVRELALGLHQMGIKPGDHIAIWSENRPEWNLADLAVLAVGAADVPIYTTQALDQVAYILRDSSARAIFVSSSFLSQALEIQKRVPLLESIICFDRLEGDSAAASRTTAEEVVSKGRALFGDEPHLYEQLWKAVTTEDLATLLYTSGTTGEPKGVMLTHKNLTVNAIIGTRWLELEGTSETALSYLPLSHIFERSNWYVCMHSGAVVAYAESIDTVAKNLKEVRPTVMTSVPRMFEKIYARILERAMAEGFPKRQIFFWALTVGRRWAEKRDRGEPVGWLLSAQHRLADRLVFTKWRDAVGGRIRIFISGGAALAPEIAYLFQAAGLTILQGYGLTETSPSVSCNREDKNRIGTVGPVIEGVSVRIAEDGEILVKGDTVMKGYYNRPTENEAAFTDDGWFKTGDVGYLDADGFLVITDRKKELIKTSGGKYIAPQRLESLIKSSRFISQVAVVGNSRKYASALIVPNMDQLRSYAALKGIEYASDEDLLENPAILDLIQRQVDKYTEGVARFETIKRVALLPREFSIESGELTPTLKPRRSVIERNYAAVIDSLYEGEPAEVAVAG